METLGSEVGLEPSVNVGDKVVVYPYEGMIVLYHLSYIFIVIYKNIA